MVNTAMRWSTPNRLDIHSVMKKYHLIDRTLNRNRIKLDGAGSPVTYWSNAAINKYTGNRLTDNIRCYCWNEQSAQPDRRHSLCLGTGALGDRGYQKYGYKEWVISTPTPNLTKSSGIQITTSNKPNDTFVASSVTLAETIETDYINLVRYLAVDRLLVKDFENPETNRVRYYYTTTGAVWTELTMAPYSNTEFASRYATNFSLPITATKVKFRIRLEKKTSSSPSAKFNSLRFRYRNQRSYGDIDDRFSYVTIPAFLAAREQVQEVVDQGEFGWKTTRPLRWWTLPEVNIWDTDLIKFLVGDLQNTLYVVQNTIKYQYGPFLQVLHRQFETRFIRDKDDILGIAHLLT